MSQSQMVFMRHGVRPKRMRSCCHAGTRKDRHPRQGKYACVPGMVAIEGYPNSGGRYSSALYPFRQGRIMEKGHFRRWLPFAIPQAVTASRVVLGGAALFAAHFHNAHLAATLITFGSITDGIDGAVARKLGACSEFGAQFDYFADYLCYIVSPAALSLLLFEAPPGAWMLIALGLPLLGGALRYPRNLLYQKNEDFNERGSPGLGTLFYAYFIVTLVFTDLRAIVGNAAFQWIVAGIITVVSCLMVTSVRYMRLPKYRPLAVALFIGLAIMPFFYSRILAGIALVSGFVFCFIVPFFTNRSPGRGTPGLQGTR
jgi:phosphatidylserine synthase